MSSVFQRGISWIYALAAAVMILPTQSRANWGLTQPASTVAKPFDSLYDFLMWLSILFFVLIVGAMIYLAIKYRAKPGRKTKYITDNHLIEAVWTFIPLVLLGVIFVWGYVVYHKMTNAPSDSYEVRVMAKQWSWQFLYEDGHSSTGELVVPMNRPVKLIMTSQDVLHSFFVPDFRIKQDVVPGMYTSVWFEATIPGKHQIYCTEYCGTAHSGMLAQVIALEDSEWDVWKKTKKLPAALAELGVTAAAASETKPSAQAAPADTSSHGSVLAEQGKGYFTTKGCVACHSVDGTPRPGLGPTLKGVFGTQIEIAAGGSVKADENYIRESIENPTAKIVKGFNPLMPTFKGQLSEDEIAALIAYVKSLN